LFNQRLFHFDIDIEPDMAVDATPPWVLPSAVKKVLNWRVFFRSRDFSARQF
jgi:hypothetical protein